MAAIECKVCKAVSDSHAPKAILACSKCYEAMTARAEKAESELARAIENMDGPSAKVLSELANLLAHHGDTINESVEVTHGLNVRLIKALADIALTQSCCDSWRELAMARLDELAAMKQKLADLNREYGCELRDPNGTIWEYAAKVQAELANLKADIGV